ncbi:aquaporin NIP1-1 [Lactuca sativa]|uniref:Aquaporin n=1 Tax=Lactuca sativa TaxID=4236 RepID=A0A9R1V916_LACSA|nr:aquaporin NIP1-1 [Lactuca sativa]KAJ0201886.1 hypothetical protein LSAT_V11C600328550 [Lactuca sativa]
MDEIGGGGSACGHHGETLDIKDEPVSSTANSASLFTIPFCQKLVAEFLGTYFMVFAGCGVVAVDVEKDHVIGQVGIAIVWGVVVMVMIYTVGHISGAHFNPAVTIAFASCKRFPLKEVFAYVVVQILASTLASGTLRLVFNWKHNNLGATVPSGSDLQSLVLEFIITFYLMFVISGVATDNRAIGELAGLAIGSTILLNAMFAGPISGASMNPARTLGPAIVSNQYKGLWVYMLGPIAGAVAGAWAYNVIRFTDKPLRVIVKNASFLQRSNGQNRTDNKPNCKCPDGWTCAITKTEPSKIGKPFAICDGSGCTCVTYVLTQTVESSAVAAAKAFCECDEGWSCVVSKLTEGSEAGKTYFECGEGCICVVDETNNVKVVCA